jgi:hypothetical protein
MSDRESSAPAPSDGALPDPVQRGAECAWCRRAFVQAHGRPVYCRDCHDRAFATRKSFGLLPLAHHPLRPPAASATNPPPGP